MTLVTILGGTGVFGSRIARNLAKSTDATLRIVGRNETIGRALAREINGEFCFALLNDASSLTRAIDESHIVIHAAGPFQGHDYRVAERCIECGAHYLDLADARAFVAGIGQLDAEAKRRGVFVTAGASSVPAVTHAMVSSVLQEFASIGTMDIALSPGNQNPRGASTIAAILSYLGKPIRVWDRGTWTARRDWGDAHRRAFPFSVGVRRVHNCDVPDLELFPDAFGADSVHFFAGVELNIINHTLSVLAALRRIVPMRDLERLAPLFLKGSLLLYRFGSKNGALAVWVHGVDSEDRSVERRIAIVTEDDGPATPCAPATILTQKVLRGGPPAIGAMPCMGFLTLTEIAVHLEQFGVRVERGDEQRWC
jgi:hypothetical protein